MANIRPVARLTMDVAGVDGLIDTNGHHFGRNWEAAGGADWMLKDAEVIPAMKAIAPRAVVQWSNMALGDWAIDSGEDFWVETRPAVSQPRCRFLHFIQSEKHSGGEVISSDDFRPGVYFRLVRFMPIDGETQPPFVALGFKSTVGGANYAITLPFGDRTEAAETEHLQWPRVYRYDTTPDLSAPLAELQMASTTLTDGSSVLVQDVAVEQLDEYLRVLISGYDEWIVPTGEHPLTRSTLSVAFARQAGMFNVQEIKWVSPAVAVPVRRVAIPSWMSNDSEFGIVGHQPEETTIAVTEDADPLDGASQRPVVTFTASTSAPYPEQRPVFYRVHQATRPVVTTVESSPKTLSKVLAVRWQRDNSWRHSNISATFRDFDATVALKPNMQVSFGIEWDGGGNPPVPATRMRCYVDGPERSYDGAQYYGKAQPELRASDHISAQLSEVKFVRRLCSFEQWTASAIFIYMLQCCGVDSSLIAVSGDIDSSYRLPRGNPPWEPEWLFGSDYGVVQMLDYIMVDTFGLQWGWGSNGYFLRQRPEYAGTPDWTIDIGSEHPDEIVQQFRVSKQLGDFRNYIMSDSPEGAVVVGDVDSLRDDMAHNYIADDRWSVLTAATTQQQALEQANAEYLRRQAWGHTVEIRTEYLGLAPDKFVRILNHPDPDIGDRSIWRVLSESGESTGFDCGVSYTLGYETTDDDDNGDSE